MKLVRFRSDSEGTFGVMTLPDNTILFTGELPQKGNRANLSCIPEGTYLIERVNSNTFGPVYEVMNVPKRSNIYIHNGNYCGDAELGFKSDVEGCLLLGCDIGELDDQRVVINSQIARSLFEDAMNGGPGILTISDHKF